MIERLIFVASSVVFTGLLLITLATVFKDDQWVLLILLSTVPAMFILGGNTHN